MLAKCANPVCSRPFLYLRGGTLFRLEPDYGIANGAVSDGDPGWKVEHFWLCDHCSRSVTLRLDANGSVAVEPRVLVQQDDRREQALASREGGMLLRSLTTGDTTLGRRSACGPHTRATPNKFLSGSF